MLTPQELREKTFEKAMFGGYDMTGVDDFLEVVSNDYAALHKENTVLKSKMKVLVDKIEEYRATEDGLRRTILAAQKMSDEQLEEAKKKSQAMVQEAEEKAAKILRDAQTELASEENRLLEAKKSSAQYIERMRLLCSKQLEFFDTLGEKKSSVVTPPAPEKKQEIPKTAGSADWDTVRSIEDSVAKLTDSPELDVKPEVERSGSADATDEPTRLFDFDSLRFGDK